MTDSVIPPNPLTVISRGDALAQGLPHYYTGTCKRGHASPRRVDNGTCVECARERNRSKPAREQGARRRAENADAIREYNRKYRRENNDARREYNIKLRAEKPEHYRAYGVEYRQANKDVIRERNAARYAAKKDHCVAVSKRWREQNLEQARAKSRAWQRANIDRAKANEAAWRAANPEKNSAKARNRYARLRAAEGKHTAADVQRIYAEQNGCCAHCKVSVGNKYHVDHIVAITRGGSNWPANLQVLCPPCNQRKFTHDMDYFVQRMAAEQVL